MELKIKIKNQEKAEPVKIKILDYNEDLSVLYPSIGSKGEASDGKKRLPVYVNQKVHKAIWKHSQIDMKNEVGGALIGLYCRDEKRGENFLVVTDVLNMPPCYFKSAAILRFTNEFLNELDEYMEQINQQYPELRRLGFYHTHPGYGVFLSGTDIRTFEGIFKDEWQIAMVIDPVKKDEGVFYWQEGQISPKNGFYVFKSTYPKFEIHNAQNSNPDLCKCNQHALESPSHSPGDERKENSFPETGSECKYNGAPQEAEEKSLKEHKPDRPDHHNAPPESPPNEDIQGNKSKNQNVPSETNYTDYENKVNLNNRLVEETEGKEEVKNKDNIGPGIHM
ncbi:MAG: Mov34/MPN/PAD-1 family protein [Candidatus Omnitrophota bacterium]